MGFATLNPSYLLDPHGEKGAIARVSNHEADCLASSFEARLRRSGFAGLLRMRD
jgi:hypothetical protein